MGNLVRITAPYPFCSNFGGDPELAFSGSAGFERSGGVEVDCSGVSGPIDIAEAADLRFRAKSHARLCGRAGNLCSQHGIAYLGFERVSAGVASYRHSVSRPIWRAISTRADFVRALARFYVVTGKETMARRRCSRKPVSKTPSINR